MNLITIENISNYTIQFINNNLILTPIDIIKESNLIVESKNKKAKKTKITKVKESNKITKLDEDIYLNNKDIENLADDDEFIINKLKILKYNSNYTSPYYRIDPLDTYTEYQLLLEQAYARVMENSKGNENAWI